MTKTYDTTTYDSKGRIAQRTRHIDGWTITQVPQSDGTWWNIRVERTR